MPWRPLPRIAFAVATYPFQPTSPADLPLELGDELYVIEQGGKDGSWYRGYLVAPPSLLAGLTSVKGQTLEARVFSGIFPRACVEVREELGDADIGNVKPDGRNDGIYQEHYQNHYPDQTLPRQEDRRHNIKLGRSETRKSLELLTNKRHSRLKDHRLSRAPDMQTPDRPGSAKPPAPVPMLKIGDETPTSLQEPLVDEIASCLREWHSTNLHELLLNRQYGTLDKMSALVSQLDLARRQLLHNVLTVQERDTVREQTTWALVKANKMLSGEVIVRDPAQRGRLLTGEDSAIEMTKLQSMLSLLDSGQTATSEGLALHHLLLEVKDVIGADIDGINITMSLCLKSDDGVFTPLSETFALNLPSSESLATMARSSKLKTLFRDLSAGDVGVGPTVQNHKLFLVVKVKESQVPKPRSTRKSRPAGYRNGTQAEGPYVPPYLRNFNPQGSQGSVPQKTGDKNVHIPIYLRNNNSQDQVPTNAAPQKDGGARPVHVPVYLRNSSNPPESSSNTPPNSGQKKEPHIPIYLKNFNPEQSNPLDAGQKPKDSGGARPVHVPVYMRNVTPQVPGAADTTRAAGTTGAVGSPSSSNAPQITPSSNSKKEPHIPIYLKNFKPPDQSPTNAVQDTKGGSSGSKPPHIPVYLRNVTPQQTTQASPKSGEKPVHIPIYLKNFGSTRTPPSGGQDSGRRSILGSRRSRASSRDSARTTSQNQVSPTTAPEPKISESPAKPAPTGPPVVRTVGAGLIDLSTWMAQDKGVEKTISIWSVAEYEDNEDSSFDRDLAAILPSPTGRYKRSAKASQILVHLNNFVAPDAGVLMRSNPTLMHMIQLTQKIGFSEAPTKPRSDIYLTFSRANLPRDAYLSHPESGRVQLPGASGMQNLQLTMEVRDGTGKRIEHCIYPSSNSTGFTAWRTTVTEVGTPWDQTICLKIAKQQVPGAHLIMSIADAPEFPFALGWMPLWDDQAFLKDGNHRLVLHSYDKATSSIVNGKGAYLSLPWDSAEKGNVSKDESVTGSVSTLSLRSYLCSTEYSQDQIILGLINWKQQTSAQLMDLLRQMVFVPEIEIVKQLSDVFDALFAIVVHKSGEAEYEDIVFNDLVTILSIESDRRFSIGPLVDDYAETRFDFPFATSCLMRSYARLLDNATAPQQARNLRAAFKVGQHLLKFIIIARDQQKLKEEGIGIHGIQKNFALEMQSIFRALEGLMLNPNAVLVGSKTLLVQHFHSWLQELREAFSKREVIEIAFRFLDACKDVKGRLILYKILLTLNLSRVEGLFLNPADRQSLIKNAYSWLAPYWGKPAEITVQWREQVRLCASVVAELLRFPSSDIYIFMPKIVASYCAIAAQRPAEKGTLSLLFSPSYPFTAKPTNTQQSFDEALLELAALTSAISRINPPSSIRLSPKELSTYIMSTLEAQKSVLDCEAYPISWLSLNIYHHRSAMQSLEYMYDLLTKSFLPDPENADDFDMELWKTFFTTLLRLVSSETLALETFPEQKRRTVWKIAGDIREQGAALLRRCWEAIGWDTSADEVRRYNLNRLGGFQVQYVPSLVCPIVELCLSVHEGLRRVAVEILQTMIVSEWALSEDLSLIETEVVASLDFIFKSRTISESGSQKLFVGELLDLFEPIASQPDDALWNALKNLVTSIDELMDLLIAAHGDSFESNIHTLRLMEFMKDMHKEDIFIRYVHELANLQEKAKNPTEAGLALQCHADIYGWDTSKTLPAMRNPAYPEQSSFARKEALYFRMIELYEDGKAWNLALANYQELAHRYERTTFDYAKLARAQRSMAKISDIIAREDREHSRYFRVSYRGLGFPASIRDKQYIHEGIPSDRMATFSDRLLKQYPSASISQFPETEDIEGQYLQVVNVSPFRDLNHPIYQRALVPPALREHVLVSMPHQFSVTSKRAAHGTSVRDQSLEKTIYTTAEPFPNLLRRSEVNQTEEMRLTPLQTAIERTWRKTADVLALERRAIKKQDPDYESLTECLTQLLDLHSPHGTCLASYRQLIPDGRIDGGFSIGEGEELPLTESETSPDSFVNALQIALTEHAATIRRCLKLYDGLALQATREDLNELFEQAYPEIARQPKEAHLPDLPISSIDPESRRGSVDRAVPRRPGFGSERPVSALITRLSSTLIKSRNLENYRLGSPESGLNAKRTPQTDRSQNYRTSLNFLRNTKGSFTPEQVHEPGSKRVEVKPPPHRDQSKDVFLRGGHDRDLEERVSSPSIHGDDDLTKQVTHAEKSNNASFLHERSRASSSALGTSISTNHRNEPETPTPAGRSASRERVRPSKDRTTKQDVNKRQSLIGSVIGSLIGGRRPSNASASILESEPDDRPLYPSKKDNDINAESALRPELIMRPSEDSKRMMDTPGSFPDNASASRIQRESLAYTSGGPSRILSQPSASHPKPPSSPPSQPLPQPPAANTISPTIATSSNAVNDGALNSNRVMSKRVLEMQREKEESGQPSDQRDSRVVSGASSSGVPPPESLNRSMSKRVRERQLEMEKEKERHQLNKDRERDSVVYFQRDIGRDRERVTSNTSVIRNRPDRGSSIEGLTFAQEREKNREQAKEREAEREKRIRDEKKEGGLTDMWGNKRPATGESGKGTTNGNGSATPAGNGNGNAIMSGGMSDPDQDGFAGALPVILGKKPAGAID